MINLSSPDVWKEEIEAMTKVINSWQLALWPNLKEFEKSCTTIAWTKYASSVNSWTSGLHLIVKALWLNNSHAVFVPSFTFIASVNCFVYEWAHPIFVDIEEETYNLDPKWINNFIKNNCTFDWNKLIDKNSNKHIKAIVWVHIFWHVFQIDEILEICKKYNLYLIEDAAESIWSEYKWKKCWQFWEASIFAFYPNKQLTTWEWWVITTNNKKYFDLFESLKNQWRWSNMQWLSHDKLWYNYRMSEINASIWIEQIKKLNNIIKKRNIVANYYAQYLWKYNNIISLPVKKNYCTQLSRFVFVIEIKKEINIKNIIAYLKNNWIQSKNYFEPVHLQEYYKNKFWFNEGLLPNTESISKKTLAIPFYNNLQEEETKYISNKIITFLK